MSKAFLPKKVTPNACLLEFLRMPISEELQMDIATKSKKAEQDKAPKSIFLDDNNPLLTQIAIYARLLELQQQGQEDEMLKEHFSSSIQKSRKTRSSVKRDSASHVEKDANEFLVQPTQQKPEPDVTPEELELIQQKAQVRAACLAEEKEAEIDQYINEILYQQQKKLRYLTDFCKDFQEINDMQIEDLNQMREACIVDRLTITEQKNGSFQPQKQEIVLVNTTIH